MGRRVEGSGSDTGATIVGLNEYLASREPWREDEALAAIKVCQAENAAKKAARDAKRQQRKQSQTD